MDIPDKNPSLAKALEYLRWVSAQGEQHRPKIISDEQIAKLAQDLRAATPIVAKRCSRLKDLAGFSGDMVWVDIGRKPQPAKFKRLEAAITGAGYSFYWSEYEKVLLLHPNVTGQRSRRYHACETLAKTLESMGWHSGVRYRAD